MPPRSRALGRKERWWYFLASRRAEALHRYTMKLPLGLVAAAVVALSASLPSASGSAANEASPIYGVTIPSGYRNWGVIAPSQETGTLNELRIIFGNAIAIKALQEQIRPLPDGSVIVKVGWQREASTRDDAALGKQTAFVPGARSAVADVQIMVKDSRRYTASGGWGFGKFESGVPLSPALHQTCFACHLAFATKARDYVFTRYAP
jgi:hypothetical protein